MIFHALVLLVSSTAPSIQLDWRGAAACPSREAFLADVRRLRGEVLEAEGAEVVVEVTLELAAPQWRARVATRTRGGQGLRVLEADTCAAAVEAAAVVVSLALAEPVPPAELDGGTPTSPAQRSAAESPTCCFALGLTGGARIGPLPSVAPGASLAASVTLGALRLEVMFTTPFALQVTKEGAQAEITWWVSGRAAGCYEFSLGRLMLAPCALVHGAWLTGRGAGGVATASGNAGLVATSAGLFARARLFSTLWVRLDGSGGVALARPRFVATSGGSTIVLSESAPWLFDANLGLEWRFE